MHEFLTGCAGTGKSFTIRERISKHLENGSRPYGVVCATTGIAAVNMGPGVTTLASELKYFDTESLKEKYAEGILNQQLKLVSEKGSHLIIDECSMLSNVQLDIICDSLKWVNDLKEVQNRGGLGILLCGDHCQLPPVKEEFCFENSKWWKKFEENTFRLTKIWRQDNLEFIKALNFARKGDGKNASEILSSISDIIWSPSVDTSFDGTTLVSKNDEVDRFNQIRLDELVRSGKKLLTFKTTRWGKERSEWKLIPNEIVICQSSYVMILSNDPPEFSYANGDCGIVEDYLEESNQKIYVKLSRNSNTVKIGRITRRNLVREHPDGRSKHPEFMSKKSFLATYDESTEESLGLDFAYKGYLRSLTSEGKTYKPGEPYFDFLEKKWCIGEITYLPIRLAYATTVYKSQGLSLDRVQINYSNAFFGQSAMSYVALSRCRTPGGLRIVGSPELLERRTNAAAECIPFF